jgi:hypothetical protein
MSYDQFDRPDALAEYLTADRECLLALLTALLSSDELPQLAARVLEDHLGLGWAREYAGARSKQERVDCVVRRLRLYRPIQRANRATQAMRVDEATSFEDGGAR